MSKKNKENFTGQWWMWLIVGILSFIFGLATIFMPGLTLLVFVSLFGAFVLTFGVVEIVRGLSSIRTNNTWWLSVLFGTLMVVAGIYLARNPSLSPAAFITTVIAVLIARGIFDIIVGISFPLFRVHSIISGILHLLTGILVIVYPFTSIIALTWVLGLNAIVYSILTLSFVISLRANNK